MKRVLLVEDDLLISRSNERLIRRTCTEAVEVVHCVTGESAIAELRMTRDAGAPRYDLVISDFHLGGNKTGGDVLEFIRHEMPKAPRFFFLSSAEEIQLLGAAYLEKPASPSELRAVISEAIGVHVARAEPKDADWHLEPEEMKL